jgi:hypothetical protein
MTNDKLYSFLTDFLRDLYEGQHIPQHLIKTMAMMLTGLFLGRHVQLYGRWLYGCRSISCCPVSCGASNVG